MACIHSVASRHTRRVRPLECGAAHPPLSHATWARLACLCERALSQTVDEGPAAEAEIAAFRLALDCARAGADPSLDCVGSAAPSFVH